MHEAVCFTKFYSVLDFGSGGFSDRGDLVVVLVIFFGREFVFCASEGSHFRDLIVFY